MGNSRESCCHDLEQDYLDGGHRGDLQLWEVDGIEEVQSDDVANTGHLDSALEYCTVGVLQLHLI